MPSQLHPGRVLAAGLTLLCLVFTLASGAATAGARPGNRPHACVLHRHAACVRSHARLARRRDLTAARGTHTRTTTTPTTTTTPPPTTTTPTTTTPTTTTTPPPTTTTGTGTPAPAPTELPVAEAPAASGPFETGVDSGTNMTLDLQGSQLLGAKLVRVEFPLATTTPAQMEPVIGGYAAAGIRVLPLATFRGTLPTPAQAQSLAAWAREFGPGGTFWATHTGGQDAVQAIEFGNETSYGYQYGDGAGAASYRERAENYARRLREGAEAIAATGVHVGVLAQADDWTGDWVNGMYAAVPSLSRYVAGWTIHPYHQWRSRLEALLEQTAAHGDTTIPIDITEFGLPTDNGHCLEENEEYNRCMPYGEAASTLRATVGEVHHLLGARLGMLVLYQVRDQALTGTSTNDEMYYGALQHELQPKGEYTGAAKELLAGSLV
jgi:hypothetical protein